MDSGLTRAEASKVLTQLGFCAGWPNVFSALPVVRDVFQQRGRNDRARRACGKAGARTGPDRRARQRELSLISFEHRVCRRAHARADRSGPRASS
jgi:hypothetical protein